MPLKIIDYGTKAYDEMVALRNNLLRKPLGLVFDKTELQKEEENVLIGCYEDDKLEACCMLVPVSKSAMQLRQMAVAQVLQGKGVGRVLLRFAENIAYDMGYKKIIMHARKSAVGFYEKSGYNVAGEEFMEVNLPHYLMEKIL